MATPASGGGQAELLAQDHHVHTAFSDDASATVAENIAVAQARDLRTICLTDHVGSTTTGVAEFASIVHAAGDEADIEVLYGVEATMLDHEGRLDLPVDMPPVHRILIADHVYPGLRGPVAPELVRTWLARGDITSEEAVETLVMATVGAMARTPGAQLAHLFSLLPKIGLDEAYVDVDHVRALAGAASQTGAVVEVNEKWDCPSRAVLGEFVAAGVRVVAASGSHRAADIGVYDRVAKLTEGLPPT